LFSLPRRPSASICETSCTQDIVTVSLHPRAVNQKQFVLWSARLEQPF
jgi:hypothetical protein